MDSTGAPTPRAPIPGTLEKADTMRKTITMLGMAGVLTFGAAACGGDSDDSEVRDSLVQDLGLTSSQADCVIDELGGDADVILKLADEDYVPTDDDIVALDRAGDECGLE